MLKAKQKVTISLFLIVLNTKDIVIVKNSISIAVYHHLHQFPNPSLHSPYLLLAACENVDCGGRSLHPLLLPPQYRLGENILISRCLNIVWVRIYLQIEDKIRMETRDVDCWFEPKYFVSKTKVAPITSIKSCPHTKFVDKG